MTEEMEMPCKCHHCDSWFDLNHGCASHKWYKGIVICRECSDKEDSEIEIDEEEKDLYAKIFNRENLRANKKRLKEIGRTFKKDFDPYE